MQRIIKKNFIYNNLIITVVCAFAIFNSKLSLSQAYSIPQAPQQLQPDRHDHQQRFHQHDDEILQEKWVLVTKKSKSLKNVFYINNVAKHFNNHNSPPHPLYAHHYQHALQPHYFNDLHLKQLAQAAKDPGNLRNGIYHNGAITYDLGLPNYKILNPYDPPEIITSDHPFYHVHLNLIKNSNNLTIEDFGVTPIPDTGTICEATTEESATITAATDVDSITATTTDMIDTTMKTDEVRQHQFAIIPKPLSISDKTFHKEPKFTKSFYGQSVLLPVENV